MSEFVNRADAVQSILDKAQSDWTATYSAVLQIARLIIAEPTTRAVVEQLKQLRTVLSCVYVDTCVIEAAANLIVVADAEPNPDQYQEKIVQAIWRSVAKYKDDDDSLVRLMINLTMD